MGLKLKKKVSAIEAQTEDTAAAMPVTEPAAESGEQVVIDADHAATEPAPAEQPGNDTAVEQAADEQVTVESAAEPVPEPMPESLPDVKLPEIKLPSAPLKKAQSVTVTLPFKKQSGSYLEVEIDGRQSWLARSSLTAVEIAGDLVSVTMPYALAKRRGLLAAA